MISNSNSHLFEIRAFVWGTPRLPGRQLSNKVQPKQCLEASPVFQFLFGQLNLKCLLRFLGKYSEDFNARKFVRYLWILSSVQTTWTEFWATLTPPPPYVDTFTK